jgi:hypothetical protein
MALPDRLKQKYLARFDALIEEGDRVVRSLDARPHDASVAASLEWGTKCASLLTQILPRSHPRHADIQTYGVEYGCVTNPPRQLAQLRGIRDDFAHGFLDDLGEQIEAEIASDYMTQAERLLTEGQSGQFDHVPAAVLAGAVLEHSLRALCTRQSPAIPTAKATGQPLTLDPLIIALKKANVFKQPQAAQLSAWAHIRNKAAHGEFDQFTREDVSLMVQGIRAFLAVHT